MGREPSRHQLGRGVDDERLDDGQADGSGQHDRVVEGEGAAQRRGDPHHHHGNSHCLPESEPFEAHDAGSDVTR